MIPLDRELHQFTPEHFGTLGDLLKGNRSGNCDTLMIACADHGTAPDNVSFARPGRFFILQHLVSSIPPVDRIAEDLIPADIEFALNTKEIQHVIVCGHLGCGIIRNFLEPETTDCGGLKERFLDMALEVLNRTESVYGEEELLELLIREHVLLQLENLQSYPFVQNRLEAGELQFHAWVVNDATARVHAYDARRGNFLPIEEVR